MSASTPTPWYTLPDHADMPRAFHARVLAIAAIAVITSARAVAAVDSADDRPTYVGSTACGTCHTNELRAWLSSHHRQAMQAPSGNTVLGNFADQRFSQFGTTTRFLTRDEVPEAEVANERAELEAQTRNEGKPEQALPKIVAGKLDGWFRDSVLMEQKFVRDEKQTITQLLGDAKIVRFAQVIIGG